MRRGVFGLVVLLAAVLLSGNAEAQCNGCGIGYWYNGVPATGGTFTGTVLFSGTTRYPNGSAAEYVRLAWDTNVFYLQGVTNGGTARNLLVMGANNLRLTAGNIISIEAIPLPGTNDTLPFGGASFMWQELYLSRNIQGSKSLALADNTKKTFAQVSVAAGAYVGGDVIYTLYCADAADRVSRSGRIPFAAQNTGGTTTCAFGTSSSSGDVTNNAKAFSSATFTCADGTNKVNLEIQADCSITTPTTLTIQYRLDMPQYATLTPGT